MALKNRDAGSDGLVCEGKSKAFGARFKDDPHPAYKPHPDCWHCHAPMGCVTCSGAIYELLCMNCRDWGNRAALEWHGRLMKTADERAEAVRFLNSCLNIRGATR
jgi:hypothetical protein